MGSVELAERVGGRGVAVDVREARVPAIDVLVGDALP